MSAVFSSLSVRNYRLYAAGSLVSNTGTWMGRVTQDWLVLTVLTDHSSTALGLVTALQFLPFVLLAPVAGAVADRFPKRRILALTQTGLALNSLVLGALTLTGVVQLWMVLVMAFLLGLTTALDNPARQAFASEMVGRDLIPNAVALNSASFNLGRLTGPAVGGLVIALVGNGWGFVVNGLTFVGVIGALALMDPAALHPAPLAKGKGSVREGIRYVRGRPDIIVIMFLVFVLGTFGMNFQLTNALMATVVFGRGPTDYGILGSVMAIGSLSAALLAARRERPRVRILLTALAGFVAVTTLLAMAPSYTLYALLLIPTGLAALSAMTTANAAVQTSVSPEMRGRVMALYMAVFLGGTPLGAPIIGWVGDVAGPRWAIAAGPMAVTVALAVVGVYYARAGVRLRVTGAWPLRWQVQDPVPPLSADEAGAR